MTIFLSYRIDHFGFLDPFFYCIDENNNEFESNAEDLLTSEHTIVTYELPTLLSSLKFKYKGSLPFMTDICQIEKIIVGKSKKMFYKNSIPWNFWNMVNNQWGKEKSQLAFKNLRTSSNRDEIILTLKSIALLVKKVYHRKSKILIRTNQADRFNNIENALQQHLNQRQIEGIRIDIPLYEKLIDDLKKQKDHLVNKLRFKYHLESIDSRSLISFLVKDGHKIPKENFNLRSYIKALGIASEIYKDIYLAISISFDYDNLMRYSPENIDIVHPKFNCVGTVTSRTLIDDPPIQHLKRSSRIIFKPKDNYSFIYCDYKQFEPGILASLSKDIKMKEIYNSADIYNDFSEYIFGDISFRKDAKILFLAYLYGMSDKNLTNTIEKIIKSKGINRKQSAKDFFLKFIQLQSFKKKQGEKALKLGYIQSNYSLRRSLLKGKRGNTLKKEERFVLSQLIQGTASYILKKSILRCLSDTEIEFLIPMHDAALFQVPSEKFDNKKVFIQDCFVNTYKEICPEINALVDFKEFHE